MTSIHASKLFASLLGGALACAALIAPSYASAQTGDEMLEEINRRREAEAAQIAANHELAAELHAAEQTLAEANDRYDTVIAIPAVTRPIANARREAARARRAAQEAHDHVFARYERGTNRLAVIQHGLEAYVRRYNAWHADEQARLAAAEAARAAEEEARRRAEAEAARRNAARVVVVRRPTRTITWRAPSPRTVTVTPAVSRTRTVTATSCPATAAATVTVNRTATQTQTRPRPRPRFFGLFR